MRVLRPFLSLVFTMLALLCGLTEIGLNQNYWTDVIVGFGLGIAMAIYLVCLSANSSYNILSFLFRKVTRI